MTTGWADWTAEAEAAYQRLAARTEQVVVAGLSMGGSAHASGSPPSIRRSPAWCCINPATMPQPAEVMDDGARAWSTRASTACPASAPTSPTPTSTESAYDGTPLRPLLSLVDGRPGADGRPLRRASRAAAVLTRRRTTSSSRRNGDYLAETYGGPVERISLERSYHVATLDYDKDLIFDAAVAFAAR